MIKLRLYVYDEWLYSNWEKELRELIEKKSKFTAKPAYVWIEYWISAEEEQRPSSEADKGKKARKVEKIISSFQELIEESEGAGVKLEMFLWGVGRSLYR